AEKKADDRLQSCRKVAPPEMSGSAFDRFGRHDFYAETTETDISSFARSQQPDRGYPEVFENLRTKSDFAPLSGTRGVGARVTFMRNFSDWYARSAIAQENDDPASGGLESRKRSVDRLRAAEHIANDVGPMQPGKHALSIADIAVDEGHVMHAVERRHVGIAIERADFGGDLEFPDALHELVAVLSVGDQLGDRDLRKFMFLCKGSHFRTAHHRAVVVHQLCQHTNGRQRGKAAQVNAGLGMAGTHQYATLSRNEREYMTRAHKIRWPAVPVRECTHCVAALIRRDAGGQSMANIDRDGESRP